MRCEANLALPLQLFSHPTKTTKMTTKQCVADFALTLLGTTPATALFPSNQDNQDDHGEM